MHYFVTVAGRTVHVDLTGDVPCVDGKAVHVDLQRVAGTPVRHLLLDGRSITVVVQPGDEPGMWEVQVDGRRHVAEVIDERTRTIRDMTGGTRKARGPKPVRAPMPGLVVRVEVQPGQAVVAGQGVVIVEAMKMENELKADAPGIVSKILVTSGQPVEKGTVLVEFEVPE